MGDPVMEADFTMLIGMSYYDMGDKPHAWEKMNDGMEKVRCLAGEIAPPHSGQRSEKVSDGDRTKLALMALTTATAYANDQNMEEAIASCRTTLAVLDTLHHGNADMLLN